MNEKLVVIISLHADPSTPSGALEGGGTHAYLRELMSGLSLKGRNSILITRRFSREFPEHEQISEKSEIFRIKIGPLDVIDKRKLNDFHNESKRGIYDILNKSVDSPFVLHSVYWNSGRLAMDISKELGKEYVHTVISNALRRQLEGATGTGKNRLEIEKEVFENAFRIFSVSRQEKRDLIELYGVHPGKIIVIGRPVSMTFINPAHDENGNPRRIKLSDNCEG